MYIHRCNPTSKYIHIHVFKDSKAELRKKTHIDTLKHVRDSNAHIL